MNSLLQDTFEQSCLTFGLKREHIDVLLPMAVLECFHGGQEFITHGEHTSDLYVILDGRVNALTDDGDKLFEAGPGAVIGEIAFIDAGPRAANAVAITAVTAYRFDAQQLRSKMCQNKDFGFAVLANLARLACSRLRKADDELDTFMDRAHELWNTCDR